MAKSFTFRFETLLRLRRQREDQQKRVVATRLRRIHAIEERRAMLEGSIEQQTQEMRSALQHEQMELDDIRANRNWLSRLRRGILEADSELIGQRAQLAQERAQLAGARKEREVLARLREQRLEFHRVAENRDYESHSGSVGHTQSPRCDVSVMTQTSQRADAATKQFFLAMPDASLPRAALGKRVASDTRSGTKDTPRPCPPQQLQALGLCT